MENSLLLKDKSPCFISNVDLITRMSNGVKELKEQILLFYLEH